jgi:hypothetical protein
MLKTNLETDKNKFGIRVNSKLGISECYIRLYEKKRILEPLSDLFLAARQDYAGTKKDANDNAKAYESEKVKLIEVIAKDKSGS